MGRLVSEIFKLKYNILVTGGSGFIGKNFILELIKKKNFNFYLAYNYRNTDQLINNEKIQDSNYIYFGLRTSLRNLYYDF